MYENDSEKSLIKVSDFGISKLLQEENEEMFSVVGTTNYQAPEILAGNSYGPKCDTYSLGTILYILLCGYPPFDDEETPDFFKRVISGELTFPSPDWDPVSSEGILNSQRPYFTNDESRS